jgi:cytochrome c-type biogenesis protein CcsB
VTEALLLRLALLLYLAGTVCGGLSLMNPRDAMRRATSFTLAAGFLLQGAGIIVRSFEVGTIAVASLADQGSLFACLLVGVYLLAQFRYRLAVLGAMVGPIGFVGALGALVAHGGAQDVPPFLKSPWLPVHVTLAFLGNAVFALAFAVSAAFLLQQNLLKSRRGGAIVHRLPAIQTLDRLSLVFLLWGFPLLTLGIVTGGFWSMSAAGHFWTGEPREILAVLTWLLYAGLLQLRLLGGLHGRRAATWTIASFALLLASYLLVNLLQIGGRHGRGRAEELTNAHASSLVATRPADACEAGDACSIPVSPPDVAAAGGDSK